VSVSSTITRPPLKVRIQFKKKQLPWLTNWRHWGKNVYVKGLEPGTNPPIGQLVARKEGKLIFIKPLETLAYELEIDAFRIN